MDKRGKGSKIIFPIIIRLFERISSGEEGMGVNVGEENQGFKKCGWGRISRFRELYTSLLPFLGIQ